MTDTEHPNESGESHWDAAYVDRGVEGVSWFQPEPTRSLELLDALGVQPADSVIDVGGGASPLVDRLLERGHRDVTVLDISPAALALARARVGDSPAVTWVHHDLLTWRPGRQFDVWHDRAVLHFLVDDPARDRYLALVGEAVSARGAIVIGTFGADGPERCSGLPVRRYPPDDLVALLEPDFEVVATAAEVHTTPGGASQSFTWVAARRRAVPPRRG